MVTGIVNVGLALNELPTTDWHSLLYTRGPGPISCMFLLDYYPLFFLEKTDPTVILAQSFRGRSPSGILKKNLWRAKPEWYCEKMFRGRSPSGILKKNLWRAEPEWDSEKKSLEGGARVGF